MATTVIYLGVSSEGLVVSSGDRLVISSGGAAYGTSVSSGGAVSLLSGGAFNFGDISAGGSLSGPGILVGTVDDYGTLSAATVGSTAASGEFGDLEVHSGGVARNVSVQGGSISIQSGGSASGDVIKSGASEYIESDGTVSGTHVLAGGAEILEADGDIQASTISSGGFLELNEAVASGQTLTLSGLVSATVTSGGVTLLSGAVVGGNGDGVASGGVLSLAGDARVDGVVVSAGGIISGNGALIDTAIIYGSAVSVAFGEVGDALDQSYIDGGTAIGVKVVFGTLSLEADATTLDAVIGSGATQYVGAGSTDDGSVVKAGGCEILYAGAIADGVTVSSGAQLQVSATVSSGQTVIVSGTLQASATVSGVLMLSGASLGAYGDTVMNSGVLSLGSGGDGTGIYIGAGGELIGAGALVGNAVDIGLVSGLSLGVGGGSAGDFNLDGGVASAIRVLNGDMNVYSGAANGDVISSGGTQRVFSGGAASGTTVSNGGVEVIVSSGSATADTVSAGGVETVSSGGVASSPFVLSGGRMVLVPGAQVTSGVVFAGGVLELQQMAVGLEQTFTLSNSYTSVSVSGVSIIGGSLVVDEASVASGGVLTLASGVMLSDVSVGVSGVLLGPGEVAGGWTLSDANLVSGIALGDVHGGFAALQVLAGARAISISEAGNADFITVSSGGEAIATVEAASGARLDVDIGGLASATTIRAGAAAFVFGSAAGTHVSSGGTEVVAAGGTAAGTVVQTGGLESIASGGTTSIATISSGGRVSVAAGGKLRQAGEIAGGVIVVSGDATWAGASTFTLAGTLSGNGDLFEDGPGTLVLSGTDAGFGGEAVLSGGVVELASSSGLGAGKLEFGAGATKKTLKIEAADRPASGGTFAATLIDFDSSSATYIDLAGLGFVTGATATLSGTTLTLKDGAYTAKFTLSGEGASKYSVFSDGAGGTEFRAAAGSTQAPLLIHAIATFDPSGAGAGLAAPVSGGMRPAVMATGYGDSLLNASTHEVSVRALMRSVQ